MNVYDIDGYFIGAENANSAFGQYLEETNGLDDVYIDELDESEEDQFIINIKRLTQKAIEARYIKCCEDGCSFCEGKDDYSYVSLQDFIEKESTFPCVIAKEE